MLPPGLLIRPLQKTLSLYNSSKKTSTEECNLNLINPGNERNYKLRFVVVEHSVQNIAVIEQLKKWTYSRYTMRT